MGSELHLEFIEPIGVDEEDCVEDDVASDAEEDERFPGVSVGERPSKEGDNNCWHALKGSVKSLEAKERLLRASSVCCWPHTSTIEGPLSCSIFDHLYSCHFFLHLDLDC